MWLGCAERVRQLSTTACLKGTRCLMADIVMDSIVMAYIVMACTVMGYLKGTNCLPFKPLWLSINHQKNLSINNYNVATRVHSRVQHTANTAHICAQARA